jgi:UDP-glucose 4-epimerase
MSGSTDRRPTVLVTGAAGFIGSALCARIRTTHRRVVGFDNLSRGRRALLPEGVPLIEGDIRDAASVRDAVSAFEPECVVHLAAMHFIPDCIAHPQDTMDVNVAGTRHVLDACRGSSVRSVILASSGAVYAPSDGPCREDASPLGPLEVYGESKLAAEQLARRFHDETGLATVILRLFNAIGRNETNPHVVPHICESLRTSDAIHLGNLAPRRDYIDTRDIAEAILAVSDDARGLQLFNVGTGVAWSVSDIVQLLGRILGRPIRIVEDRSRMRATERMVLVADIEKIRRATAWTPRIPLEDSLKDLVASYGLPITAPSPSV